ncbi:MAG: phytanoyl-CoA dioxygenase family protein [Leptospira sp.]|nr:phytanoyl-CoA dioxygenase family protein [Leptospira sp.]
MNFLLNIIKKLLNKIFAKSYLEADSKSGLWLDWANDTEITKRKNHEYLFAFKKYGYVRIPKLISDNLCDALNDEFKNHSIKENVITAIDEFGLHSRLCNFHMESKTAKEIAFNKILLDILDQIFDSETILCSSLYFEKGSEQRIHRDGPFFYTSPKNLFVGVWIALEDIKEGTGELIYYPKGHTIPISVNNIIANGGGWNEYTKDIESECKKQNLSLQKNIANKGDVLIWHAELPHGGAAIEHPSQSHKSIVFHYKAKSVPIYGEEVFFKRAPVSKFNVFKYRSHGNRKYIDQGKPFFAKNEY